MRWLALLFTSAMCIGCGDIPEGMWVTRLEGVDAWVGITVKGSKGAAFLCGGEAALETHTRWMLTDVDRDAVVFREDDFLLDVTLSDGDAEGKLVEPEGSSIAFTARRVREDELAGVYFGRDAGCGDGLIVLPGGDPPEALGAWCENTDSVKTFKAQVTPVMPVERTPEGVAAFVDVMGERRDFVMTRVDPGSVTP